MVLMKDEKEAGFIERWKLLCIEHPLAARLWNTSLWALLFLVLILLASLYFNPAVLITP